MKKLSQIRILSIISGITGRNAFPKPVKGHHGETRTLKYLIIAICFMMVNLSFTNTLFAQTIAQRGAATTASTKTVTTITIAKPTNVVAGDVMIANIENRGGDKSTMPSLSGWTTIYNSDFENAGAHHRIGVLYRVAGASEPSSYTFTIDTKNVDGAFGGIVAFSGVDNTNPIDVKASSVSTGNSSSISASAITTTYSNDAVLLCYGSFENETASVWKINGGSVSNLFDGAGDPNGESGIAWELLASAGSTGSGAATLSDNKNWGAFLFALKPACSTPLPVSVAITASANPVCASTSVTFTATPTNGGSLPSYQWKVNGTNAGTNSATYSYTPANNDAVTCILTSNAPCSTGSPATSNTVTMTVNQNLPASVSIAA